MLTDINYIKILDLLDKCLWQMKSGDFNSFYCGICFEAYFENSVFCIDNIDVNDYFDTHGEFDFDDRKTLKDQYGALTDEKRLGVLAAILTLMHKSSYERTECIRIIDLITKVLARDLISLNKCASGDITITSSDLIGQGSYCDVLAIPNDARVVKKQLRSEYKNDDQAKKRLKYEYDMMKKLEPCQYILKVYDYISTDHAYYMEKAECSLCDYIKQHNHLSFDEILAVVMDILQGMDYAHQHDVIHRDLHLGNILKVDNEFVISDFGLAKDISLERSLKSSNTPKNSHMFLAPEGMSDFTLLDKQSDIYSLGAIIDCLCTKGMPGTRHPLQTITSICMRRNKQDRYPSVAAVIKDIETILKDKSNAQLRDEFVAMIKHGQYDVRLQQFLLGLSSEHTLSSFIIAHNLSKFGKLLLMFDADSQAHILESIEATFSDATRYNKFEDYNYFTSIAYEILAHSDDVKVKSIAAAIMRGCADVNRFDAIKYCEQFGLNG